MKILMLMLSLTGGQVEDDLNPQNVYDYCVEKDVLYPEIATAQAIWETGWFKCTNCSLDHNNIFGFYYNGAYKEYDSWKGSVVAYKSWQDKYYDTDRNYYAFLSCIYTTKKGRCVSYSKHPEKYNTKIKGTVRIHAESWKNN